MPNHVINKIIFSSTKEKSQEIMGQLFTNGEVDFNRLMPAPTNIYQGNLNEIDDTDFRGYTWYEWNIANWGTKWNAYNSSYVTNNQITNIIFDTAWNSPSPVIIAFANIFKINFEYRYCEATQSFWGIEHWKYDPATDISTRIECRKSMHDDLRSLCIELLGYDIEEND